MREGMEQGAVGVSSGLDYVPSIYADEDELTALCEEIAPYGGGSTSRTCAATTEQKAPAALQRGVQHRQALRMRRPRLALQLPRRSNDSASRFRPQRWRGHHLRPVPVPVRQHHCRDADPAARDAGRRHRGDGRAAEAPAPRARKLGSGVRQPAASPSKRSGSRACRMTSTATSKAKRLPDRRRAVRQAVGRRFHLRPSHRHQSRGGVRDPAFRRAAGVADVLKALMKHPLMSDGRQRRHLRWRRTAPARNRLLRAVHRPPRPQRRLVPRRSGDEVFVPHRPPLRPEGPRRADPRRACAADVVVWPTRTRSRTVQLSTTARRWRSVWNTYSLTVHRCCVKGERTCRAGRARGLKRS